MDADRDFIEVYPGLLPASLCDRLLDTFAQHPGVQQGQTGHGVDKQKKLSRDLTLDAFRDLDDLRATFLTTALPGVVQYLDKYAMALMGSVAVQVSDAQGVNHTLTPDNYPQLGHPRAQALTQYLYRSGNINIQQYQQGVGGYPHWHSEQFPQQGHNEALHRIAFYMFYLNDVAQGGETEFYYQRRLIKPTKGTMVIAPAGFTHSHRGNIPISGDKYIATSWIMFNRAEQLYGPVKR